MEKDRVTARERVLSFTTVVAATMSSTSRLGPGKHPLGVRDWITCGFLARMPLRVCMISN